MRNLLLQSFIVFSLLVSCKETPHPQVRQDPPRNVFPGLFDTVQLSGVFPDSKTFPDCVPLKSPQEIMEAYQSSKGAAAFNLKDFVSQNFRLPAVTNKPFKTLNKSDVEGHINELWEVLTRNPTEVPVNSSLLQLPKPYVVPGGRFREIYYWDSYFTMLGLAHSGRHDLIENMVNNFASLIRTYGFIPNGNRTYYLTRSQPPFFSLMVRLLMEVKKEKADSILKANRDALEKEYKFWMDDRGIKKGAVGHVVHLPDGSVLNRYCDKGDWPREEAFKEDVKTAKESQKVSGKVYRDLRSGAESGWDFSSRWFADGKNLSTIQTTDIIAVDLNCLLYHLEQTLAMAYTRKKDDLKRTYMLELAERRKIALDRFCWDRGLGYFRDYNWRTLTQTPQLSLAGMYPLYFKMVKQNRANAIAVQLQRTFLQPGGLLTTPVNTGQQWDAPNGWAPLQWLAISGLNKYGNKKLAMEISRRWVSLNIKVFNRSGKLMEKYNVVDTTQVAGGGEYPTQDGFGWTNGVLLSLLKTELND
ncbi:alpha,alpha-trehalase TreF [Desertivirga arenae]|uniref:alpha,alpha-trehalase TreF n=1 Tax=Desertivirga arenae TaxID=2810309 RepID=UPI001A966AE3|nr:alpha,alpha-trehalase TreF [Pedobacter sp. SYSU D00823]